jgi:hypothetical protein
MIKKCPDCNIEWYCNVDCGKPGRVCLCIDDLFILANNFNISIYEQIRKSRRFELKTDDPYEIIKKCFNINKEDIDLLSIAYSL